MCCVGCIEPKQSGYAIYFLPLCIMVHLKKGSTNERPIGMTGIQQAVKMNAAKKDAKVVSQIADGVDLAEMRKRFLL